MTDDDGNKVHADASTFSSGVTKEEAYEQVLMQAEGLFFEQRNWVCNLANTASLLWHAYKSMPGASAEVNWAGFYTIDPLSTPQKPQLILAPFQGAVACQTILFGRGVCGTAALKQTTQLVPDVRLFPGHIACDARSLSEIVVPIVVDGRTVAIIDVDCAVVGGFDEVDKRWLERLGGLVGGGCDWP
ncbi:GAF domain-like protein [Schizothecium vesticola]|uniref:GAF domain-like protein n=1 Tax=Schizothecium vesticola TaxID=314040 RepID=A0AA40F843_9PEZI|nr:GAF domain-like protein [Schizothecium vesticola]